MSCPACGEEVDDGAAICPHCEAILDTAAFEGAAEPKPPPPKAKTSPGGRPSARPAAAAAKPAEAAAIQQTWGRGAKRRKKAEVDYSADRILGDTFEAIRSMLPFDQLAFWGMVGMGVALLFPWRTTQVEGDEIGVFGGGWPVVVLLLLAAAALFLRTSDDTRGLQPHHLAAGQIAAAVLSVGYCAWYFFNAIDNHPYHTLLGTTDLKVSEPRAGVVLCAFAAIATGAGSVWAWMIETASAG